MVSFSPSSKSPAHELVALESGHDNDGRQGCKRQDSQLDAPEYPVYLQRAMMIAAVIYLWSLPWLKDIGFTNTCTAQEHNGVSYSYPYCLYDFRFRGHDFWVCSGASVSDYIAQPQATGLLAALLFWSCLHLWLPGNYVVGREAYRSLLVFQIFFGAFLSCPVTRWPTLHMFVVQVFCMAGMVHMFIMYMYSPSLTTTLCAWTAICGFLGVCCTGLASFFFTPGFCNVFPYAFYFFEALGLSAMTLFVVFWENRSLRCC